MTCKNVKMRKILKLYLTTVLILLTKSLFDIHIKTITHKSNIKETDNLIIIKAVVRTNWVWVRIIQFLRLDSLKQENLREYI